MPDEFQLRQHAIRLHLAGKRVSFILETIRRSKEWFYKWLRRYQDEGVDGLRERSRAPKRSPRQWSAEVRRSILAIRDRLARRRGPQNRYRLAGAPTIQHELEGLGYDPPPSRRAIERILQQAHRTNPAFHFQPACVVSPYPGPRATHSNEVHQLDIVGPRYLTGSSTRYYFLVYKDAYDQTPYVEFHGELDLDMVLDFLVRAWQYLGLPRYLQVDNGWLFAGTGRWSASLNRFIRLALLVGIELIFIPEGEPFWNGAVENFNGWFQERLLAIRLHSSSHVRRELKVLMQVCYSEHIHPHLGFQTPAQARRSLKRRMLPANFDRHTQPLPITTGKVTFIRHVRVSGRITILGVKTRISKRLRGQYVRATLYTRTQTLKVYLHGKLIKEVKYPIRGLSK
jgi:transposase InsO family protein